MGKSGRKNPARTRGKKRSGNSPTRNVDQTKRVYNWENQWLHWNYKAYDDLKGPRRWMRWALKKYDVPYTKVREHHRQHSMYRPHDHTIFLTKAHWNLAVVLHEAAHAIHWHYYGTPGHGRTWMGIFLWLLERAGVAPRDALRASLTKRGIQFSHMMTPKVLKRKGPASLT